MEEQMSNPLKYEKINWFDEKLDDYYGHENDGRIFGLYTHEGEDIVDVTWYKSENERDEAIRMALINKEITTNG